MIYKNTPKPKNTYAKILAASSLLIGAALFILANLNIIDKPALLQLVGIILFTIAIYIASLFLLRQYTFSIDIDPNSETNELDFVITERKGNRNITVCRVGLKDVIIAREVNQQNKKEVKEARKKMARYTYDVSFIAPRRIELICKIGEDDLSILVTYDEQLLSELNKLQQ